MDVFVVEQLVPADLEMDEFDTSATHYLASLGDVPIATARVLDKSGTAKIGRVAVVRESRGLGIGAALMTYIHEDMRRKGFTTFILEAQTYALSFYEKLGYVAHGDEFLDAGIPHKHMSRVVE